MPTPTPSDHERMPTIVIVRDASDHSFLIRTLEREGYQVQTAKPDGTAAQFVVDSAAALVILELDSADAEGLALCRTLKGMNPAHPIPVIAVAQPTGWDERVAVLGAGADAVFSRSVEVNRVLHKIDELVGGGAEPDAPVVLAINADRAILDRWSDVLQRSGYSVVACPDPETIFPSLGGATPDVLVLGAHAGTMTGLDLYEALKRQDGLQHVPVLFVADDPSPAERQVALSLGIDDYVSSPDPCELMTRIATRVSRTRFFKRAANRDALTGALNYRAFIDRMSHEITRAARYEVPLTLVLLDMDKFKQLNDRFGHLAGNRALQELVMFLRRQVRKSDLIARMGGDEFAVLMIQASKDLISSKWDVLRRAFRATPFQLRGDGEPAHIGFSFGMASCPQDGDVLDRLIASADSELYRQKGRIKTAA